MAREKVVTVEGMNADQMAEVLPVFKEFMKEAVVPQYIGVTHVSYSIELRTATEWYIIAETNRQLNKPSVESMRRLIVGFFGGWKAAKKTQEATV